MEISQIIDRFHGARVLVVGDVMLDRYWWGTATRISPEAPVPVVGLERVSCVPGGAANVAANVAGFGAAAVLAGVVGDDESGRLLAAALGERGIGSEGLVVSPDRPTTTKTRVLVHNHQLARIDEESRRPLGPNEEAALIERLGALVPESDVVVLSDYAKGCLTRAVIESVVAAARSAGRPVLADPKSRDFTRYDGVTLLTPNLGEAAAAAGIDPNDPATAEIADRTGIVTAAGRAGIADEGRTEGGAGDGGPAPADASEPVSDDAAKRFSDEERKAINLASAAAERILAATRIGSLLVTLSEHGMALFTREHPPVHFPSLARQVFDVTGAGDTVIATVATALAAGANPESAATLANIAAGISVEKVGTSVVGVWSLREGYVVNVGS